jgi:hypothetical protein
VKKTTALLGAVALGASLFLYTGCALVLVDNQPPPPRNPPPPPPSGEVVYIDEPHDEVDVEYAPPPLRHEEMSQRPSSHHVWVHGHWYWRDGRWAWVRGYWIRRPHDGSFWVEAHWDNRNGHYHYVAGYWR